MLIYIYEDLESDSLQLNHLLYTFSQEKRLDFEITSFSSGEGLTAAYRQTSRQPDLLFLDISIDVKSGVDMAKELRDMGYSGGIIFTLPDAKPTVSGNEVNALYYLQKPFDYSNFVNAMEQCGPIFQKAQQIFSFIRKKKQISVPFANILFFETGQPHTVILHTVSETLVFRGALSQIADYFCHADNFLPVGRSFVINLDHVTGRLRNDLIMSDGSIVQIPLRKQEDVLHVVKHWQKDNKTGHRNVHPTVR